jgi:hypothetical protein
MTELEEYLMKVFRYDPKTGIVRQVLRNYVKRKEYPINTRVGTVSHGYEIISVRYQGKHIRLASHRLAFLFMNGSLPPRNRDMDHINGDKLDNRWSNLRLARRGENNMNSLSPTNNTSGYKGVVIAPEYWFSIIIINKKRINLGASRSFKEAVKLREKAELKYFGCILPQKLKCNNSSGREGVFLKRKTISARIKVDGKIVHLGVFENFEDALVARKQAEQLYFGEFAKK